MKIDFPQGFWWGAATSGIQSEGNTNQKNKSVWELWYEKNPERFEDNIGPQKVCDTYNKYKEDVKLMKDIKLNSLILKQEKFVKMQLGFIMNILMK